MALSDASNLLFAGVLMMAARLSTAASFAGDLEFLLVGRRTLTDDGRGLAVLLAY